MADRDSIRSRVYQAYTALLRVRAAEPAFHPFGGQCIPVPGVSTGKGVFSVLRTAPQGDSRVLCLHNVSGQVEPIRIVRAAFGPLHPSWMDLLTGEVYLADGEELVIEMSPYGICWLRG